MPASDTAPSTGGDVLVVARRDPLAYLVVNHLAAQVPVSQVVFERDRRLPLLKHRLRRLGARAVAGQLLFLLFDRLWIQPRSRGRIALLLAGHDRRPPDDRIPTLDVDAVNGDEFRRVLERVNPAVVVVAGTGIIKADLLRGGPVFLNIHCGITPRYRGVHGGFWAIANGEPEQAGTTIHVIDPGVDTGPVVAQRQILPDPWDTYRTLPVKQYLAGLDPLAQAARDAATGNLTVRVHDQPGRQWYSPTLRDHRRFRHELRALGQNAG